MDFVQPKKNLGTSLVPQGAMGRVSPDVLPHAFGRIVAVALTETCDAGDLRSNASPPPDTSGWGRCRFRVDVFFPIDERARGTVTSPPAGPTAVHFVYVSAIVADSQIEIL